MCRKMECQNRRQHRSGPCTHIMRTGLLKREPRTVGLSHTVSPDMFLLGEKALLVDSTAVTYGLLNHSHTSTECRARPFWVSKV